MSTILEAKSNATETIKKFRKIETAVKHGMINGVDNSLRIINIQASTDLRSTTKRTGLSRPSESINQSWHRELAKDEGGTITGILHNTSPHCAFVEFGTGEFREGERYGPGIGHIESEEALSDVIVPTNSSYLRYIVDGNLKYSPYVRGQQPKAYFRKAISIHERQIPKMVRQDVQLRIREIQ